jgi:hypothetical protein
VTTTTDLLADSFTRVREGVAGVLNGIEEGHLLWRPDPEANTIAWLVWHTSRVQDDHLAAAFGREQVWPSEGWEPRFALSCEPAATGYGMGTEEVGRVIASGELLLGYHMAVSSRTASLIAGLADSDLERIVDRRWDPPVTLGVRLVSVIDDGLQHVGQAAYVRGLAERASARG